MKVNESTSKLQAIEDFTKELFCSSPRSKLRGIKLKRRRNTNDFRFTVKARDLACKQAIIEKVKKAEDEEFKVRERRYRLSCRLYFACTGEKWRRFYHQVKGLCKVEQAVTCPCPDWLRKTILKNLRATAANGRGNQACARRASQILAAIN